MQDFNLVCFGVLVVLCVLNPVVHGLTNQQGDEDGGFPISMPNVHPYRVSTRTIFIFHMFAQTGLFFLLSIPSPLLFH